MILFPAIDLKNGQCVRLSQGDADRVKVYNSDPLDQAKFFEKNGVEWLHTALILMEHLMGFQKI